MAFDQATRNQLAHFVSQARNLLSEEFTRQLQNDYGLDPDSGEVTALSKLPQLDDTRRQTAQLLRDTMEHYLASSEVKGLDGRKEVLGRIVREQAFTVLNRLCALRMAESRGLLTESIGKGYNSEGFQLYFSIVSTALGERGHAYRAYLFGLFDEFAIDLPVLFDRFSPQGRLFPRESVLLQVLDLINQAEIDALWAEDETIGWIYQYWNTKEERRAMRDASAAPRNSRELAVRNQFFTPRYVVEFLTDNTLGRIWYEMTQGKTRLKEECRYLVRRPNEVFLQPGENAPEHEEKEGLSQEELLQQPVYIAHRAMKDPREIRLLDPACGSMHFGLYSFDLFERIYDEAWDLDVGALRTDFPEKEDLLREVPRLIIEHNIHGIDIDPRAVQIAGLSLWLRAQRTWHEMEVAAVQRPRILRSNIVCAEPMPGNQEILEAFISTLDMPLLGELVKIVFERMKLAGEAGALLKIEEEIREAIDEARQAWEKIESKPSELFSQEEINRISTQPELTLIEKSLRAGGKQLTGDFWDSAEQRVFGALRVYAAQADVGSYQRRLFADDAARGFAFIDLCRQRYDAVVMNPPFGEESLDAETYCGESYEESGRDIAATFVERARFLTPGGIVGCIVTRALLISVRLSAFRIKNLLATRNIATFADLGGGVLDAAVDTAALVIHCESYGDRGLACDLVNIPIDDKEKTLLSITSSITNCQLHAQAGLFDHRTLVDLPDSIITGWIPDWLSKMFSQFDALEPKQASVIKGLITGDDFRFVRLRFEVSNNSLSEKAWKVFPKGGDYSPYYSDQFLVVNWDNNGAEIKEYALSQYGSETRTIKNQEFFGVAGIGYSMRSSIGFAARPFTADAILADDGPIIITHESAYRLSLLAFLNSTIGISLLKIWQGGSRSRYQWIATSLQHLPVITLSKIEPAGKVASDLVGYLARSYSEDESYSIFAVLTEFSPAKTLAESYKVWTKKFNRIVKHIQHLHEESDKSCAAAMGCSDEQRSYLLKTLFLSDEAPSQNINRQKRGSKAPWVAARLSYVYGSVFGRWDIRFATGERQTPELPDPFAPLPVCPPGMLQNADGLPAEPADVPADYPLRISWPGILVDDENNPEDIVTRVRESIEVIWRDRAEAIEQEACEILGVRTLRDYFGKPAKFFADHLKRYSKSRRQAPIYWPLSTPSGKYTLWLYYHRLTDQTLYTAINDFVEPKLKQIAEELVPLRSAASRTNQQEQALTELSDLELELKEFRDELLRIAGFWKPNLNDGVLITASPLWKLFNHKPWQKKLRDTWNSLEGGKFDWAHLALSIWPERVVRASHKDRSFAIAHEIEDELWHEVEVKKGRGKKTEWRPRDLSEAELEAIVAQVKAR